MVSRTALFEELILGFGVIDSLDGEDLGLRFVCRVDGLLEKGNIITMILYLS